MACAAPPAPAGSSRPGESDVPTTGCPPRRSGVGRLVRAQLFNAASTSSSIFFASPNSIRLFSL